MKSFFITGTLLIFFLQVLSQNLHQSIHAEQQQYYNQFGKKEAGFYDSINGFSGLIPIRQNPDCQLQKVVFGFHPYWAGSDYLNYQWNLIDKLVSLEQQRNADGVNMDIEAVPAYLRDSISAIIPEH